MSPLFTVRTAAARLGVSYSTLKQWIYDGGVRTVRTKGGHHRLSEAEVQRLLLSNPAGSGDTDQQTPAHGRSAKRGAPRGRRRPLQAAAAGVLVALSGRNQLRGVVEEVRGDGLLAQVRLRIGDQRLTAVITQDAIAELKLKRGDEAVAIIKSTEVMIGRFA
jgi:molybdopterin-binding protein